MFQIDISAIFKKGFPAIMILIQFYISFIMAINGHTLTGIDFLTIKGVEFILISFRYMIFFNGLLMAILQIILYKRFLKLNTKNADGVRYQKIKKG